MTNKDTLLSESRLRRDEKKSSRRVHGDCDKKLERNSRNLFNPIIAKKDARMKIRHEITQNQLRVRDLSCAGKFDYFLLAARDISVLSSKDT